MATVMTSLRQGRLFVCFVCFVSLVCSFVLLFDSFA